MTNNGHVIVYYKALCFWAERTRRWMAYDTYSRLLNREMEKDDES